MGLPTTWFVLNLVHLFWIDEACRKTGHSKFHHKKSAVICGDDLVAFWPKEVVDRYHKLLEACGAKKSQGKHFVSDVGRGVFTEKPFKLKRETV